MAIGPMPYIGPNALITAQVVVNKHPTPWHIANVGKDGSTSLAWICDDAGQCVIGTSEWLDADYDTLDAIVTLFNCLHPEGK